MNQTERDVLKTMGPVLKGDRTQVEAARLLGLSVRQVRRLQRRLESEGDGAVVHGLRGQPSNRRLEEAVKAQVLRVYRERYAGFGPTLASEKLAQTHGLTVAKETLRQWLLAEGLWSRQRRRDRHRSRRQRRSCFGEMVQADASDHDWLEGRGPRLVLVGMIDDATSRVVARFHVAETTEAYMDVLWRWIGMHGRPVSWYTDGHSIFRAESKLLGADEPVSVPTQFSRALEELGIELILANSPQAKGRIERLWGTAQDRLVKELRLAGVCTLEQANDVLEKTFLPWFNRHCVVKPGSVNDAHRPLDAKLDLAAIFSHQQTRTVANDYTIRFENQAYQLLPPAWPGLRGAGDRGAAVGRHDAHPLQAALPAVREGRWRGGCGLGGSAPRPPEFTECADPRRGGGKEGKRPDRGDGPALCGSSDRRLLGSHSCVVRSFRRQERW